MSNAKWLETLELSNIEVNDDIKNGEITSVKVKQSDNSWRIFITLGRVLPWDQLSDMLEKIKNAFMTKYNVSKVLFTIRWLDTTITSEDLIAYFNAGVDVCKKYNENPNIIHAVEAHHNDVEPKTVIACLVQAADAISAARPGARSENYESYIKRLQKLEEICKSYQGIEKCYAVQAGREIRIMVAPEVKKDEKMVIVARKIASQIEKEMDYPGQIKINLIRESRVTDYAK